MPQVGILSKLLKLEFLGCLLSVWQRSSVVSARASSLGCVAATGAWYRQLKNCKCWVSALAFCQEASVPGEGHRENDWECNAISCNIPWSSQPRRHH